MASLRDAVKDYQDELRAGIAWVVFWREGRSWSSDYIYPEVDDTLTPEDRERLQEIQSTDPAAVVLNGYYSGYLGEDMSLEELTAGVRRHYKNGYNNIADFIEAHDNTLSPEQIEEAREAAHAAGLPFSEKPYRDGNFDPYAFDGSMSVEDYELMHRMMNKERSDFITDDLTRIDTRSGTFNMQEIENRRFMYQPQTGTLILGRQYHRSGMYGSHAEDHGDSGAAEPFDSFIRGWIGTGKEYPHGIIHFAPNIDSHFAEQFDKGLSTLEMFAENGAVSDTVIRGFGDAWEQPLSNLIAERSDRVNEQFSILIDSRSRAQTGEPGGVWLSMPATAEQLHAAMQSVGISADNPQDFFINGYFPPDRKRLALPYDMVCAAGIDELNFLAARLAALDPADLDTLNAAAQRQPGFENIGQIIDFTYNTDFFVHIPEVQTAQDLGDYYLNKSGMVDMPEEWKKGIDLEAFGRNAAEQEHGSFTPYGYIVESGDQWERHFEGRDVPEEYRIMSFPQPSRPNPDKVEMDAAAMGQTQAAQPTEPRPVIPLVLTAEKPAEKIKEITDRLEQGITEVFDTERYKDYLRVMSKFHNYSFRNTLLIAMQAPDASLVAGFNAWKNTHGRNVKRGEKGIKIFAPSPYKVKRETAKLDPQTQQPIIGKDGKPVTEEKEITVPAYKVVSVFDVSQTEGREIPSIGADELTGDVDRYKDFFVALEKTSPVPIGFENIEGSSHGYYHLEEKRIAIQEGMSELQNLKTAIHEIAHAKLHDIDLNAPQEEQGDRPDRRTREVQAESVAYTVCQHYGLDTSDYSFGYVAGWSSGKELSELKSSLETIRNAAAEIIDSIDANIAELQQAREAEPIAAEQGNPAFDKLTPEQQQKITGEVKATLQMLIDADIQASGEVTAGTLEAIAAQGYSYEDGQLAKRDAAEQQPLTAEKPKASVTYYPINEGAARRAKEAMSYDSYKPGSATAEYRHYVDKAAELAARQKKRVDPSFHAKIDGLLDTYARKLAANMNKGYEIAARVPSILIAGGSNFPVKKKQKQNAADEKNMQEFSEIQGVLSKIRSTGMGGISADDPNAISKLESKLAKREALQETMKAVNAYYRKHKTIDGCPHLTAAQIEQMKASLSSDWRANPKPFETYQLSNNSAEIRRLKERIATLTRQKEVGYVGWEFDGGKVEANAGDNRLQIFFDEKPDADTRDKLKEYGFKWSPSAGAWQRQLTDNAIRAADALACIAPLTGERPTEVQKRARQEAQDAPREKAAAPEYIYKMEANPRSESSNDRFFLQAYLPQEDGKAKIGDVLYIGTAEKCREIMVQLAAGELTQGEVKELYAKAQEAEPDKDTFSIYQLKRGEETRDFRFEPYDRLQAAGLAVDPANYDLIYTAPLTPGTSLEDIFTRFNIDHPADFKGHSLSVSDVVVLHQAGQDTAHYVDSIGYQAVPEFLREQQELTPDARMTGEQIRTPRGSFHVTDMTREQMEAAGYGFHHQSEDGKYFIMANGTQAFAVAAEPQQNYLKHIEDTVEQNDNSFDGIINNTPPTPTVDELEAKVQAGEQISLLDLADAIKAEKERGGDKPEKKPSIRAQLKADKERAAQRKTAAKAKS